MRGLTGQHVIPADGKGTRRALIWRESAGGDAEQDNRHGTNKPDENKMEEHVHPDCRFLSPVGHCHIGVTFGAAALGILGWLSCSWVHTYT